MVDRSNYEMRLSDYQENMKVMCKSRLRWTTPSIDELTINV